MKTDNVLLGLELAMSLAQRLMAIVEAARTAAAAGRDLSAAELQRFVAADDDARARLAAKIAARRAGG